MTRFNWCKFCTKKKEKIRGEVDCIKICENE